MRSLFFHRMLLNEPMGCFGEYSAKNTICAQWCSRRLECCITQEKALEEQWEDQLDSFDHLGHVTQ
ncbi:MAG: hypothetical protein JRI97_05300 [Deltaproteobacteria bacterium]|nr:hypothetical protein [Deltaproteobacteria bacterium]